MPRGHRTAKQKPRKPSQMVTKSERNANLNIVKILNNQQDLPASARLALVELQQIDIQKEIANIRRQLPPHIKVDDASIADSIKIALEIVCASSLIMSWLSSMSLIALITPGANLISALLVWMAYSIITGDNTARIGDVFANALDVTTKLAIGSVLATAASKFTLFAGESIGIFKKHEEPRREPAVRPALKH